MHVMEGLRLAFTVALERSRRGNELAHSLENDRIEGPLAPRGDPENPEKELLDSRKGRAGFHRGHREPIRSTPAVVREVFSRGGRPPHFAPNPFRGGVAVPSCPPPS